MWAVYLLAWFPKSLCHGSDDGMLKIDPVSPIAPRLVSSLYTEALVMMDESRSYFEADTLAERDTLGPVARVAFACESLRVTTRLMHIVAWLMARRMPEQGLARLNDAGALMSPLPVIAPSEDAHLALLPPIGQQIVRASMDLYERVRRLDDEAQDDALPLTRTSPARSLMQRLQRVY